MKINKDELKNSLTIEQVFDLVSQLGGEPKMMDGFFISRTICHNPPGKGSYKLYYYDNTKLFSCFTDCGDRFDIFELVLKVNKLQQRNWSLYNALYYIASYFGYSTDVFEEDDDNTILPDWAILNKYCNRENTQTKQIIEMKCYDNKILNYLPTPRILNWENEGISESAIKKNNIKYDPVYHGIVIPHYDINNNLIGIRSRTLIKEDEEYGKYRPSILNGKMYNHPLSFNLYNLNNSKINISTIKKAIVFESEKSCLLYNSIFGEDNDISVACCGSSLINYQVKLLLDLGVQEIIIAFDKQFQEIGDDEFKRWTKKLMDINNKYSKYTNISFMFDKFNLLNYKSSPIDEGKEKFLFLFENRIIL